MRYEWKVSIPSTTGKFDKILDVDNPESHTFARFQQNRYNVGILCISWTSLLADSPIGLKPNRTLNNFITRLLSDPVKLILLYTELYDKLVSQLVYNRDRDISAPFLAEFKDTPIFKEYLAFYRTQDSSLLRYILTFLAFGKKSYYVDESLDATALRKWHKVEERLAGLTLPAWTVNLRDVMRWLLSEICCDVFLPKHGNGAVAERGVHGIAAKNLSLFPTKLIDCFFLSNTQLSNETKNVGLPSCLPPKELEHRLSSRLKFVPKDLKSSRSICMEPVVFQWAQQGARLWIEHGIKRTILKNHIDLEDQGLNQRLSRIGSIDSSYDTIDLSSASDSVSWRLIKSIVPYSILKYLAACRTSSVELPDGTEFALSKFAPMGSSLCFPTQTILYSSIILMISMARCLGRDWREPHCFDGLDLDKLYNSTFTRSTTGKVKRFKPFACYGDDIVLDNRTTSNTIEALNALGFEVNVSKSFTGDQVYRESCGSHWFKGDDVTPLYFKVKSVSQRISIESMTGVIDAINRAHSYGFQMLRKSLIAFALYYPIIGKHGRTISAEPQNPILFTSNQEDSMAIVCVHPRNTHLRKRVYVESKQLDQNSTSQRYQRDEVYRVTAGPSRKKRVPASQDNYFYTLWWRSRYVDGGNDGTLPSSVYAADVIGVDVKWDWSPTRA